jgi:hypothetical protein
MRRARIASLARDAAAAMDLQRAVSFERSVPGVRKVSVSVSPGKGFRIWEVKFTIRF